MFSDAKNNYFGEQLGVSENKGCPKNMFSTLKIIISVKNRGYPKTKGVRKHGVITVLSWQRRSYFLIPKEETFILKQLTSRIY